MAKGARRRDEGRAAYWREAIQRREASGQSVRAFCRSEGVKESAYYHWRRELARRHATGVSDPANAPDGPSRRKPPAQASATARFVPVALSSAGPCRATLEIVLPGGVTVRVADGCKSETLVAVLGALESQPC